MATKKSSKQSAAKKPARKNSKRSAGGRASVAKGRKFEDDVAELYRLQGAEVVQNIEICNKKVDILVTFSYPVRHRVIVECKDEGRAVDANQRVMQFHGLLTSARKAGEAESAEIITRVPWGDAAKGYANREGIRLLTYAEKIASLIDFTRYLKELVSKFEDRDPARPSEPALGKYYVDLSAVRLTENGEEKVEIIDTYVQQWLDGDDTQRHLAIFGEYGAGKSTYCQKLAHDLAASFLEDPNSSRIPILLNLREFIGKVDIEAYITSFLDRECKVSNPKIDLFHAMNDAGIFLLIFDGLDEMAVKVDADTLESNLVEIEKLAASGNSKVILTSRPEYFVSAREEQEAVSPALNPLLSRKVKYDPVKILPWDENQVTEFLQKRVPLVEGATEPWKYYRDRIRSIGSLSDLSQRPVLLDMIVKTLPALIASKTPINRPNLYRTYLIGEIKRQRVQKRRTLLITEQDRLSLLQLMAVAVYKGDMQFINFADARNLIEERINPSKYELEAHTRDFLTNSFLIRTGDEYHFSHKSIMEYLVAAQLNEEIRMDAPDTLQYSPLQPVIVDFLKEFDPDRDTLLKWVDRTKERAPGQGHFLGGNAATLLCALTTDALAGKDLSGASLNEANLMFANLKGTNLKDTVLHRPRLQAARFSKGQLTEATIRNFTVLFLCTSRQQQMIRSWEELKDKISAIDVKTKGSAIVYAWNTTYDAESETELFCMMVQLSKQNYIDTAQEIFSEEFDEVALYHREYTQLQNKYPKFKRLIAQATRERMQR
ncbi:MAG TPA: NACHT domain-containing protein [Pyrinomonadaceae bacterium]|nr:NACHT domain-containing protein [Pyrinomonadaceae bacterium]